MKKFIIVAFFCFYNGLSYSQFNLIQEIYNWGWTCSGITMEGMYVQIPTEDSVFFYYSRTDCSPSSDSQNAVYRTDDSFQSYSSIFYYGTMGGNTIDYVSAPNGHCCYIYYNYPGNIDKYTISSGWTNIAEIHTLMSDMCFVDDHNGFAITYNGLLYKYENDIFLTMDTIQNCFNPKINFFNLNTGFIICKDSLNGQYNKIIKSTDNGDSWVEVLNDSTYDFKDIKFVNDTCFLVTTTSNDVLKSNDQGLTWNYLFQIHSNIGRYSVVSENKVFGIDGLSILKTENYGNSWVNLQTLDYLGIVGYIQSIVMLNDSVGYLFGNASAVDSPFDQRKIIYKTTNGGVTFSKINKVTETINIYPNPCNGLFSIKLQKKDYFNKNFEVRVFNSQGQLVFNKRFDDNLDYMNINIVDYAKGIYSIVLSDGIKCFSKKILLD